MLSSNRSQMSWILACTLLLACGEAWAQAGGGGPAAAELTAGSLVASPSVAPQEGDDDSLARAMNEWWARKKQEILGGDFDFTLGARVRVRSEARQPVNYASVANSRTSDDRTLLRTRLHFGLDVNEHVSGFVQIQDSRVFGEEAGLTADLEGVDLHNGYIRLANPQELFGFDLGDRMDFVIHAGRFNVPNLGDQRMLSDLDWSNVGRTLDGFRFDIHLPRATVYTVAANIVESTSFDGAGRDAELYIVYLASTPTDQVDFDAYAIWRNFKNDGVTDGEFGTGTGDVDDVSYGIRGVFRQGGLRVSGEGVLQAGSYAHDDVNAYAWALEGGYRAAEAPLKPGVTVGWTFATGDRDSSDNDQQTFRPVAPFGHAYQGHMDTVGWQNGDDYYLKLMCEPCPDDDSVTLHADYHIFRLDRRGDAWYDAAGTALRSSSTSGRDLGRELDVYTKFKLARALRCWLGYSHFWRGRYIRESGGGDQGDFAFLQMELFFGKN